MIKIENLEVCGLEATMRGARNPKNSWHLSDSIIENGEYVLGEKDKHLLQILSDAGTDHGKFMRMITVYIDITAPLYWWKEFDTYKVGTVANSCSTMHKIHAKEFVLDDFSTDHLYPHNVDIIKGTIAQLNIYRKVFLETNEKEDWWQLIQLLPSAYNQKRTVMLNYAVLKNMYNARKNHKLDEWREFCGWIESLPYAELIIGTGEDK